MTTVVHVNQHILKRNRLRGTRQPALTLKKKSGGKVTRAFEAVAHDEHGREMFRVVYRPDHPLPCGAVCWVETTLEVTPQETDMSATTIAPKPAKAPKPVSHDITVSVKAPPDLSPAKVQKAIQEALSHGCKGICEGTSGCDDKVKTDLSKVTVAKVRLNKPAAAPGTADAASSTAATPS